VAAVSTPVLGEQHQGSPSPLGNPGDSPKHRDSPQGSASQGVAFPTNGPPASRAAPLCRGAPTCAPVFLPPFSGEEKKHGATHGSPPTGTDRAGQAACPHPELPKSRRPRCLWSVRSAPHNRRSHARVSAWSAKARGSRGDDAIFPAVFPEGSRHTDLGRTLTPKPAHAKQLRPLLRPDESGLRRANPSLARVSWVCLPDPRSATYYVLRKQSLTTKTPRTSRTTAQSGVHKQEKLCCF
jgi:hypothetical protein